MPRPDHRKGEKSIRVYDDVIPLSNHEFDSQTKRLQVPMLLR